MTKSIMILSLAILIMSFVSRPTFSQTSSEPSGESRNNRAENAVRGMVQSHRIRLGIFRLRPSVSAYSGYDSNALLRQDEEIGDYFFDAAPAVSAGIKLGRKSYLAILEQVNFVYYKELEQRRDIYSTTRAEFVTGTNRLLATFSGGYQKRTYPLDKEVDVPVEQEIVDGGVSTEYTLSSRVDFRSYFHANETKLQEDKEITDLNFQLFDTQSLVVGSGIDYQLKQGLDLTADVSLGRTKILQTDRITNFWSVLGGVHFTKRRITGGIGGGYGESYGGESTRKNFLANGDLNFLLGKRLSVGAFVSRNYQTSALLSDALRLTTEVGVRTSIPIASRLSVSASYSYGINDYGDSLINGQTISNDHFQYANGNLSIKIIRNLSFQAGVDYQKRETDIPGLTKERVAYLFGLGYSATY